MANRWLFAGGGFEQIRVLNGAPFVVTTAGRFNASYADHAVSTGNTAGNGFAFDFINSSSAADTVTSGEKLFVRFRQWQFNFSSTASPHTTIRDSSGFPWLGIRAVVADTTLGLYYNSGTGASPTWTRLGSVNLSASGNYTFDFVIWVTLGSPHSAGWAYKTGAVWTTVEDNMTFTAAGFANAAAIGFHCPANNLSWQVSEVAATVGIDLIGSQVNYLRPTGAGSNSGMTGAATAIDDAGLDDTDSVSSTTAGQKSTFAYSNLVALGGNDAIGDVFLATRAKNDGSAPLNCAPVRRTSGGTDNTGSNFSGISNAYQTFITRYSGLSESEINGSEFGAVSAT